MNQLGQKTRHVLLHQTEAARRALDWLAGRAARTEGPRDTVVFVGSGTSYYLAMVAAFYGATRGLRALAAPACEIAQFPAAYLAGHPQTVVISRSGETTEGVAAAQTARRFNCPVVAVTCREESTLTRMADQVLLSPSGQDGTLVMLRSFTSMLLLLLSWMQGPEDALGLAQVAEALDPWAGAVLAHLEAHSDPPPSHLVVLGSGAYYGLAREAALKAEEMALLRPEVYHALEYRHGPRATLAPGDAVVLLAGEDAKGWEAALLAELRELGADTWVVTAERGAWEARGHRVLAPPPAGEAIGRSPLAAVAVQALAWHWAVRRGVDPDAPPHLTDVVALPELFPAEGPVPEGNAR